MIFLRRANGVCPRLISVADGVDVFLASDGLSKMIKTKYHTIPDAVNALGSIASIQTGFIELQRNVYVA